MLTPGIFKAYDVRGKFGEEFDVEGAGKVAFAFAELLYQEDVEAPVVILARDARPSSDVIADKVRSALVDAGLHVFDIGLATTPLYYFAIHHLRADGGIMVTASHNPLPYNGLKLCRAEAVAIGLGSGMEAIRDKAMAEAYQKRDKGRPKEVPNGTEGRLEQVYVVDAYLAFLQSKVKIERPLQVVIDAGNGMAGLILKDFLALVPQLKAKILYENVDCTFPNHEANPAKEETLKDLKLELKKQQVDLGIAFDGDVDRVGFVTPSGKAVRGDYVTAIVARYLLASAEENAPVLYEVRSSRIVPETVQKAGGKAILVRPGHALINNAMRQYRALFGGELSGHYFFRDFFFRDDGMLTMITLLNILASGVKIEDLVSQFSEYVQSGEVNFEVQEKSAALVRVEAHFANAKITKLDGLTVEYDDWWFNLRPSNTEDLLRLNVEAKNEKTLQEKLEELRALILR